MTNFESLGLAQNTLKAIADLGFENPTPVQEACIPFIMQNKQDLIANAQTGTGKTAAFGLPMIQRIDVENTVPQLLILSPTRELAMQIAKDLQAFTKYDPMMEVIPVYGGASIEVQIKALRRGGQIVVGTPGRMLDLIKRKKLNLSAVQAVVLDEADEMLSMGFKDELDAILETTPDSKQTLLFSATMPKEVSRIASTYMTNPHRIVVGKQNSGAENVRHLYYMVNAKDRYLALKRLVDVYPGIYAIVFCRTRRETKEVADHLMRDGYNADALHGDLSQAQREYVMARFHNHNLQVLVATDVAARGLDVDNLSHVINYNLPDDPEVYVHRSGRTGRAGKSGVSLSIIHSREQYRIRKLEKMIDKTFEHGMVPSGREVCEKQLFHLVDKMERITVDEEQIADYLDVIYKKLSWLSREDLIKRFVSEEFNRFLDYYSGAKDLNISAKKKDRKDRDEEEPRQGKKNRKEIAYTRFFISLGTKNGMNPRRVMKFITSNPHFKEVEIGDIELFGKFCFVEVDATYEAEVYDHLEKQTYDGLPLRVEVTKAKSKPKASRADRGGYKGGNKSRFGKGGSKRFGDNKRSGGYKKGGGSKGRSRARYKD